MRKKVQHVLYYSKKVFKILIKIFKVCQVKFVLLSWCTYPNIICSCKKDDKFSIPCAIHQMCYKLQMTCFPSPKSIEMPSEPIRLWQTVILKAHPNTLLQNHELGNLFIHYCIFLYHGLFFSVCPVNPNTIPYLTFTLLGTQEIHTKGKVEK